MNKKLKTTAIVYCSSSGSSMQYAKKLSEITGRPVYSIKEAKKQLEPKTAIIFIGWVKAGFIQGLRKAGCFFSIQAVCAVCLVSKEKDLKSSNRIDPSIPLFILPGMLQKEKLRGANKLFIKLLEKFILPSLQKKETLTPNEEEMMSILLNKNYHIQEEKLFEIKNYL